MLSRARQAFPKRPRRDSRATRGSFRSRQVGVAARTREGGAMSRVLFIAIFVTVLLRWAGSWRRVVGVTLIATLTAGVIFPTPAYAQFGLLGGIQNILNILNGA